MNGITLTKMYDLLTIKLGKDTAENLTNFIESKIDNELENKSTILATKEDLAKLAIATKEDIAKLALATKDDLAKHANTTKEDLAKHALATKEEFAKHALATKDEFARHALATKDEFAKHTLANKEEFAKLTLTTKEDLAKEARQLDVKITDVKSEIVRWMFIFWIGQIIAMCSFILIFIKN